MTQLIYKFQEGQADMKDLLGGKGANLAEMTRIGLPIPHGFTITTQTCLQYLDKGQGLWPGLIEDIQDHIQYLEEETNKAFSDPDNLLLVSVRSGAAISMPGMMDTILNVGLNDQNVSILANLTQNPRFA